MTSRVARLEKLEAQVREIDLRRRSFGDWMRCLWKGDHKALLDRYQSKAALSSASGTTGGYTVPVDFVKGVLTEADEASFFLKMATRVPLTTRETIIPHVAVTGGAAGVSPFFGGVAFTWDVEGADVDLEAEPAFQATTLTANTLAGYALVSNQMMADASLGELGKYLEELLGRAAGWALDYACLNGNGTGQPLGVIHAPGTLAITRGGANDVAIADLAGMATKLIPSGWSTFGGPIAVWAIHPSVLLKLFALSTWMLGEPPGMSSFSEPGAFFLHGLPCFVTEKVPGLGTKGDVSLFIPRLYVVGMRQEVEVSISRDEPTAYLKNQSVVRMVLRADGRPRLNASVTLADGSKTAAAQVVLL